MLTLTLIAALQGSLLNVHHAASLTGEAPNIGTGILLVQDAPPLPPPGIAPPLRTLQGLRDEKARLDATRPSLGGPIAMLAVGAGLALVGLAVGLVGLEVVLAFLFTPGLSGGLGTFFTVMGFVCIGVGVVALGVGIPLAVIGGVRLKKTINERTAIGAQMNLIDEQMKALENNVPPPLPLPNSVERNQGPQPLLVLADF